MAGLWWSDPRALRRARGLGSAGRWARTAARAGWLAVQGFGSAWPLPRLPDLHLEPVLAARGGAFNGQDLNPLLQDPGPRLQFAVSLHAALCGSFDGPLLPAVGRPHRGERGSDAVLGPVGWGWWAWTLLAGLKPHRRYGGARVVVGLITNSAGAGSGSGIRSRTPSFMPWLFAKRALPALGDRRGKARGSEGLDDPPRDPRLRVRRFWAPSSSAPAC